MSGRSRMRNVSVIFPILDWPINSKEKRRIWREVFNLISDAHDNASNVVLVHCRHGKDRSCFAVYAFLRLVYEMNHEDALWFVQKRVNNKGNPLFKLEEQSSDLMKWVDDNLGATVDAESGICCWEHGTINTY